jgi:hypothetical protein
MQCLQPWFAGFGGRMKRIGQFGVLVMVLALAAGQAFAAPKRPAAKKPPPKPAATETETSLKTTFAIYDIGTLRMTGKTARDATYIVGKLELTGRAAATIFSVGPLSMTGKHEP